MKTSKKFIQELSNRVHFSAPASCSQNKCGTAKTHYTHL